MVRTCKGSGGDESKLYALCRMDAAPEGPAMPNTAKEVVRGIMGTKLKVNPFLARLKHSISNSHTDVQYYTV